MYSLGLLVPHQALIFLVSCSQIARPIKMTTTKAGIVMPRANLVISTFWGFLYCAVVSLLRPSFKARMSLRVAMFYTPPALGILKGCASVLKTVCMLVLNIQWQ